LKDLLSHACTSCSRRGTDHVAVGHFAPEQLVDGSGWHGSKMRVRRVVLRDIRWVLEIPGQPVERLARRRHRDEQFSLRRIRVDNDGRPLSNFAEIVVGIGCAGAHHGVITALQEPSHGVSRPVGGAFLMGAPCEPVNTSPWPSAASDWNRKSCVKFTEPYQIRSGTSGSALISSKRSSTGVPFVFMRSSTSVPIVGKFA